MHVERGVLHLMTEPPDFHIEVLRPVMREWEAIGAAVCLKWTCPACGERVVYPVPNQENPSGYLHEQRHDGSKCGRVYRGSLFGLMILFPPP